MSSPTLSRGRMFTKECQFLERSVVATKDAYIIMVLQKLKEKKSDGVMILTNEAKEKQTGAVSWISGDVQNNQFDLCATHTDFRDVRVLRIGWIWRFQLPFKQVSSISRDSMHKRRATGGKKKAWRKKRKYELGRQPANTKISSNKTVRRVRVRGGNVKGVATELVTVDAAPFKQCSSLVYDKGIWVARRAVAAPEEGQRKQPCCREN
ncbi:40S ribosomal protein S8 [Tanacetum coccineum]|uniref:40S ribosomal protein S8 n=1 Tax=Tanacetum coccineum TaxID=301880 RepID=A0ABQ5AAI8_9ASTR